MRGLIICLLLLVSLGCARNHFNVPEQHFADRVKVLGVAPIMVDTDSDLLYPQKDQLISLTVEMNRRYEQQFVRKLKGTGSFYTVALMDGDPATTFTSLLYRRERRDDASVQYNKYFWKNSELKDYIRRNKLDAVMLIVVSGLTRTDTAYSSTLLSSLTGEFNHLIMTSQIVDAEGTVLWEYPNFRGRVLKYDPLIRLQYPDFDEAQANLVEKPNIKFKTIEGIRRRFEEKRKDYLLRQTQEPDAYGDQFDEMISYLSFNPDATKAPSPKEGNQAGVKVQSRDVSAPNPAQTPMPQTSSAPVSAPAQVQAPAPTVEPPSPTVAPAGTAVETPLPAGEEIVPAATRTTP